VRLGEFAAEALAHQLGNGSGLAPGDVERVIRFYLREKPVGASGWPYPRFLRDRASSEEVELELGVEDSLWNGLEAEAHEQGVAVERLLEHALLYYAAEIDAGRIAGRILEDFESEEEPEGA
jgi:hypothetical protein